MDWFLYDNGHRHERINLEHARAYWEKTVSSIRNFEQI